MTKAKEKLLCGYGDDANRIVELLKLGPNVRGFTFTLNYGELATLDVTFEVLAEPALDTFEYLTKRFRLVQIEEEAE